MNEETGGPALKCARCDLQSTIKQGHQWLCDKHYRFGQMRSNAKVHNKLVPSHADLHEMSGSNLICGDCGIKMNWRSRDGQATVASLQHYRNGEMAIVCRSCNTRHGLMEGDTFRDMPMGHKYCPCCKKVKPFSEFTLDASRSGPAKRKSKCRECSDEIVKKWRSDNKGKYNAYQRNYRERRKMDGNPVRKKSDSMLEARKK